MATNVNKEIRSEYELRSCGTKSLNPKEFQVQSHLYFLCNVGEGCEDSFYSKVKQNS